MPFFACSDIHSHDVALSWLGEPGVVVVRCAAFFWLFDEMKKVLMSHLEPIAFRSWRGIRLMPNEVIAEDPIFLLHGNGKSRWDKQKLLLLAKAAHRRFSTESAFV